MLLLTKIMIVGTSVSERGKRGRGESEREGDVTAGPVLERGRGQSEGVGGRRFFGGQKGRGYVGPAGRRVGGM